jgi:RimJ/RimL family protein N-acetyltransferase
MTNKHRYVFTSDRLGFRNWLAADLKKLAAINADKKVMEFFPNTQSQIETIAFIDQMHKQFERKGFCYFAVDKLESGELIGFIGLSEQNFESDFTPCIDIGWRLKHTEWNNGLATEGAKRCLQYAFDVLKLEKVNSIAPVINLPSINVMKKIGMQKVDTFKHPKLVGNKRLEECVLYEIKNDHHKTS